MIEIKDNFLSGYWIGMFFATLMTTLYLMMPDNKWYMPLIIVIIVFIACFHINKLIEGRKRK